MTETPHPIDAAREAIATEGVPAAFRLHPETAADLRRFLDEYDLYGRAPGRAPLRLWGVPVREDGAVERGAVVPVGFFEDDA